MAVADMTVNVKLNAEDIDLASIVAGGFVNTARRRIGQEALLKHGKNREQFTVTACVLRLESDGFKEQVEITTVSPSGIIDALTVDPCMVSIDEKEPEGDDESADFGGIHTLPEDNARPEDTVILTPKAEAVLKEPVTPLEELREAVTAVVKLQTKIQRLINEALPVGTKITHGRKAEDRDGVVTGQTTDYSRLNIPAQFGPHSGLWPITDMVVDGEPLDLNFIPF